MTAQTDHLEFRLVHLIEQGNSGCNFKLMKSASTMSPYNVGIRPVVPSASSYATTHVMVLCLERSIDLSGYSILGSETAVHCDRLYVRVLELVGWCREEVQTNLE